MRGHDKRHRENGVQRISWKRSDEKSTREVHSSPSRDIPFHKPMLIQSNVPPVLGVADFETDTFEMLAGGPHSQALSRPLFQKLLAKTAPLPCPPRHLC